MHDLSTPAATLEAEHGPGLAKSPRRVSTYPADDGNADIFNIRVKKRIIVCCDGTWQDGVATEERSLYTNILRLARSINSEDARLRPPVPQVVFYQSGIGSVRNLYARYVEGTTGASLGDKVEEAYAFIAHNYFPGDEIFLFGFSRGAYTVRMVAMFIGEIGILDHKDMDNFASIFISYQKLGKSKDEMEIQQLKQTLGPWRASDSRGKLRVCRDEASFTIKCLGVFDTVGALGLPEELTMSCNEARTIFGFPDRVLGPHVERAYHALALHETRADFNCAKFEQTAEGRAKNQVLKQCWFTGCHADIGGGWPEHDLTDLTLLWMAANVGDALSLDVKYIASLMNPIAPWGAQQPHDPVQGIFVLARTIHRPIPTHTDDVTHETIHASVLEQASAHPALAEVITKNPGIVAPLLPLETEARKHWPFRAMS